MNKRVSLSQLENRLYYNIWRLALKEANIPTDVLRILFVATYCLAGGIHISQYHECISKKVSADLEAGRLEWEDAIATLLSSVTEE